MALGFGPNQAVIALWDIFIIFESFTNVRWYLENQEWMDGVTSGDYQNYYEDMYKGR